MAGGNGSGSRAMAEAVHPDDPASIIFTTGTAIDPKGAVHTHRTFLANVQGPLNYYVVKVR